MAIRMYRVTFSFGPSYNNTEAGLTSAAINVAASNKFDAMSDAWRMVASLAGVDEPREVNATTVGKD